MSMSITSANMSQYDASLTTSAAENPAGIAIAQEHLSQAKGYEQGARNGEDGQGVIRTADSALSSISDSLQRMREISLRASNSALYTKNDRALMQEEINQLKEHITSVSRDTQFNTKKLLDGSMADMHLALNPEGGGLSIRTTDATLENLGLADYDVTGKFDISKLDDAIAQINNARSSMGAQSNALDHSISMSRISAENATASYSKIADKDIEEYITEQKKNQVMEQYRYFALQKKSEQNESIVNRMLM